jgi:hypothetical protein
MDSPIFTSFNEDRSRSGSTDLCINLFPERDENEKMFNALFLAPTLLQIGAVGVGPIRCIYQRQDKRYVYVVSSNGVYQVDPRSLVSTFLFNIPSFVGPVYIQENTASNSVTPPGQILVVDGASAWCWNYLTNTLSQALPGAVNTAFSQAIPSALAAQDGFAITNNTGTNQLWQSAFGDFSNFPSTNYSTNFSSSDNVVALGQIHREIWVFKGKSVEVNVDAGTAGAPGFNFEILQGVEIPVGCTAPASVAKAKDGLIWLGGDETGQGVVFLAKGYNAVPVSTFTISQIIQNMPVSSDAIGFVHQFAKHWFYEITFPTANVTFCYDLGMNKWHQRASFSQTGFGRNRSNCHFMVNSTDWIGDYQNGKIYTYGTNSFQDAGVNRRWLRSWRALPDNQETYQEYSVDKLVINFETGMTVPPGTNPQICLRWSYDGGYTWPGSRFIPLGKVGQTAWKVFSNRMGSTQFNKGTDIIFEISGSDPINIKVTGAQVEGGAR